MADQLEPGEIALKFGENILPSLAQNVTVGIVTTSTNNDGKHLTSAKFIIEFDMDPTVAFQSYDSLNNPPVAGGYLLNYNELGFSTTDQSKLPDPPAVVPSSIVDPSAATSLYILLDGKIKYLDLKIPIVFTDKRDSGD